MHTLRDVRGPIVAATANSREPITTDYTIIEQGAGAPRPPVQPPPPFLPRRAAPRSGDRLQHGQLEPIWVSETEVACAPRRIDGLGIESAAAGLDGIRNGIDVLGGPDVGGGADAA